MLLAARALRQQVACSADRSARLSGTRTHFPPILSSYRSCVGALVYLCRHQPSDPECLKDAGRMHRLSRGWGWKS